MTPEQEKKLNELYDWMTRKKIQQIDFPLDDASKNNLKTFVKTGTAASTTQTIALSGNAQNITPPAQPDGFLTGVIDGAQVYIPYYNV